MLKYYVQTFGCQMNVHESEKLAGALVSLGLAEAAAIEEADVVVFNTCCIRDTAEQKIVGNIGAMKPLKKENPSLFIAVVGCMTQQEGSAEALQKKFPFIDLIMGTTNLDSFRERVKEGLETRERKHVKRLDVVKNDRPDIIEEQETYRTSMPNAWVNIMYGCNNFCTYCIVPYVRGRERSRAPEAILAEIKGLLAEGYKEITLLGQNVNSYGSDRKDTNFLDLLSKIAEIGGKFRLRFMTSHPKDLSDEVIELIAKTPNFCKSIHLPVQAGSNAILKAMHRYYTREQYLDRVAKIRELMPDCGITTDIMVGFPGETEDDFADTIDLVERVRYSNAFTFIYSPRKGTPAAAMEQIPYAVKRERIGKLIALQNQITKEISETYIGKRVEVLCEDAPKAGFVCGRTDNGRLVNFPGEKSQIGQFVTVKITSNRSASLWGVQDDSQE